MRVEHLVREEQSGLSQLVLLLESCSAHTLLSILLDVGLVLIDMVFLFEV